LRDNSRFATLASICGPLAQLAEHLTFNQGVAGSRPARPTRLSPNARFLDEFLHSRRQGTSPRTNEFYEACLRPFVNDYDLTPGDINSFLANLSCNNGRNAYYRAIRAFCNWLYRQGYIHENPITKVDPPKMTKVILPSLTPEQVEHLIASAESVRDKAIVSLFADSGIRLNELLTMKANDIDLSSMTVTVWGKGGKQRKAPFTKRTAELLRQLLRVNEVNRVSKNIWGLERRGIQIMLYRLQERTGLNCNPHTFRRTFASNLHRAGLDVEHIMRLGGWESLDMVLRYTRSVKFEDSLKLYREMRRNSRHWKPEHSRTFITELG
jgi:site-specific recombinase XerD